MKIAYVTVAFPFGFGEAFFLPEIRELISQGHEVLVVPRSKDNDFVHSADTRILRTTYAESVLSWNISRSALLELLLRPVKSLKALGLLFETDVPRTFLKNIVVYPKGLWLGRLVRGLGVDHIHAQWASTTSTMALIASTVSGVSWSFSAHRGDIAAKNLFEVKLQHAAFVRFISRSGMRMAEAICAGGLKGKERLIHMGVMLPQIEPRAETSEPTILCPANLKPVKGHKFLFEAIALLQNRGLRPRLEVIGDGPLRGDLEEMVVELGIGESVRFLGKIPQEDLVRRYSSSDVAMVVLPSVDLGSNLYEGIPVSLIEAMSFGIPVISTNTGGIPELLGGGAGIIVPPGDPIALGNAIESIIHEPALRLALSQKGRERVASDFNIRTSVIELTRCMSSVIN